MTDDKKGMFDLNGDGKISVFEKASAFSALRHGLMRDSQREEEVSSSRYQSLEDEDDQEVELLEAGICPDELLTFSSEERENVLLDAGLDPDDFDFPD